MATKDHCLSLKGDNQKFGFSNQNGQYSNLNLNANQNCSSILETFQSNKSISNSSNSKKNDYACTKALDENIIQSKNNSFSWNKSGDNVGGGNNFSKDSNIFGTNDGTSKKWKSNNPNSKKSSSNNSTLSLHITAYENSIEAQNGLKSASAVDEKKDGTNLSKRKINKVMKVFKSGFASMVDFEIPRQQTTEDTNDPEIMGFKASQKLFNPNVSAPFKIEAAGDTYSLGSLFNACKGIYTSTSGLPSDIKGTITTTGNENEEFVLVREETIIEKCKKLDISAEMALSILCGALEVNGRGKFLESSLSNEKETTYSFVFKRTTVREEINFNDESIKNRICNDTIKNSNATHILSAAEYGGHAIVNVTYQHKEGETKEEVKAKLEAAVKWIGKFDIKGGGELNSEKFDSNESERFQISANFSGSMPAGEKLPTDIHEVPAFIQKVPLWVRNANGGKGIQLKREFTPISYLPNRPLNMEFKDSIFKNISAEACVPVFKILVEMSDGFNYLNDLESDFTCFKDFIEDDVLQSIKSKKRKIEREQRKFKHEILQIKCDVQRGLKSDDAFSAVVDKFYDDKELTFSKVESFCRKQYSDVQSIVKYLNRFKENDVICIGKDASLKLMKNDLKTYYALYCNWADKANLMDNLNLFLEMSNKRKETINSADVPVSQNMTLPEIKPLVFIASEFISIEDRDESLFFLKENRICEYFNGRLADADCLQTFKRNSSQCFVKCTVKKTFAAEKPKNPAYFYSPCPLSYQQHRHHCNKKECEWYCFECRTRIKYDFNYHFYCECGIASVNDFVYCCSDPLHGTSFEKFNDLQLIDLIGKIRVNNDMNMNILLLSEPGIDVNEWISIYAKTLTNSIRIEITQSETHGLTFYTFHHGRKMINFIDISKVCDSNNRENNPKDVWKSIAKYEEFHGICVLVKRDNSFSSKASKKFIMNGLLASLPPSSAKNFVFCVTDGGDFSYPLGEILEPYIRNPYINVDFTPKTIYFFGNNIDEDSMPNDEKYERIFKECQRFYNHFENDIKPFKPEI